MNYDYIIVGSGLAGLMLCEQLRLRGKTFVVISKASEQASVVASGLYNPVVLKRFNKAWNAEKHLPEALSSYDLLEVLLDVKIDDRRPIYRVFHSIEEQNNWFLACDKPILKDFLKPKITENNNDNIVAPYGFGEVRQTGRVDTKTLLQHYQLYLESKKTFIQESFEYQSLQTHAEGIKYKGLRAKHLIFAEGFGLKQNPYFKSLPLEGTKGELLVVFAPKLQSKVILKSGIFVIPIGKDQYLVGSTYAWEDYSYAPTERAKHELVKKLSSLIKCPFEVVDHRAGIRPTVVDRRPLLGQHSEYSNLFVLNGLGSRGVLLAPSMAKCLIDYIEAGIAIPKEINIERFRT